MADPASPTAGGEEDWEDDWFDGTCFVCGEPQRFTRRHPSLREGYICAHCKALLRYQGQAVAILRDYARHGATSIAELVKEPEFAALDLFEPGELGPFREYFAVMPGYVMTSYWLDVDPGDVRDGVRCENLMALTFADQSFDVVITSDIFEHVRKPSIGFAEVHRVLRPGGRHIFSIPVQEPMREVTVERVDTTGEVDVHILEPRYHRHHLVYNDFGVDLLANLDDVGFDTDVLRLDVPNPEAARLLTFSSTRRP
jgi:SAM-dependent methyltransferase